MNFRPVCFDLTPTYPLTNHTELFVTSGCLTHFAPPPLNWLLASGPWANDSCEIRGMAICKTISFKTTKGQHIHSFLCFFPPRKSDFFSLPTFLARCQCPPPAVARFSVCSNFFFLNVLFGQFALTDPICPLKTRTELIASFSLFDSIYKTIRLKTTTDDTLFSTTVCFL